MNMDLARMDVHMRAAAAAESSIETRREVPSARLIAGVSVGDSPLITDALEYDERTKKPKVAAAVPGSRDRQ